MGAGRIYWGQIVAVLSVIALGLVVATQWVARALNYQVALGSPDWAPMDLPLYAPYKFFVWWFQFDFYARDIFNTGAAIILFGAMAGIACAFGFSLWRAREARKSTTYGAARWADARDVEKLQLFSGDGIVLGAAGKRILRHNGDEHVLVVAPTNTGKSVGISLPTSLIWPHSYLGFDLKGEAWAVTAGLRADLGPCFCFAPGSFQTHRYNPLTQIRRGDRETADAQILADVLVDPEGALRARSHWQLRAFELLTALMLWTLYAEREKTLARMAYLMADPARPITQLLGLMLTRPIKDGAPHPVVASGARQLLDMAEAERSGVVSTALSYLALYRDPIVAKATEASDFAIEDLVTGERPVSIYVVAPPEELSRLRPVLRLFFNQALKRLTETAGAVDGKGRRVLVMFDEFVQLGRLDFFENALAYIRGYKVRVCMAAQSLNQIAKTYDENNSILDNAHVRVAFACNDERTAKRISDMLGSTTETRSQMNYAGSRMAPWLGHTMVSRQEAARPLLTPGEVMQLPADECLILTGGAPPIRARKVRYFSAPLFADRLRRKPVLRAQTGPGRATDWDSIAPLISEAARPQSGRPTPSSSAGSDPLTSRHEASGATARQQTFEFSQAPGRSDLAPEQASANPADIEPADAGDDLDAALKPVTNALQQAFLERGGFDPGMTEE